MRNLKRALSLALASVMLLGMMVVGTSASYADVTSKQNKEAIEVAQAVGVMVGDDKGNFNPDAKVTRVEMAVVMSNLLNLKVNDFKAAKTEFTDVPAWAAPYVAACKADGIIAGYSATYFGANDTVTAAQAALMVMKALGYFQYAADFGDSWQLATVKQASKIDLYDGIDANANTALTRNDVAQLVLNALEATMVETDGNGGTTIKGDGFEITTGSTKYVDVLKTGTKYTKIGKTEVDGKNTVELGEDLFDGKLVKDSGEKDDLKRPANKWTYKGEDIGTYSKDADEIFVLNDKYAKTALETLKDEDLMDEDELSFVGDKIYLNGAEADDDAQKAATVYGTVIEVYENDKDNKKLDNIVMYNIYLASVSNDSAKSGDKKGIKFDVLGADAGTGIFYETSGKFTEDDLYLVTFNGSKIIDIIGTPKTVEGDVTRKSADYITVSGTKSYKSYAYATSETINDDDVVAFGSVKIDEDTTYTVYLDNNGYIVAVVEKEDNSNSDVVYVKEITDGKTLDGTELKNSYFATVVYMDGTSKKVQVAKAVSGDAIEPTVSEGTFAKMTFEEDDNYYKLSATLDDDADQGALDSKLDFDKDDKTVKFDGTTKYYVNSKTTYIFISLVGGSGDDKDDIDKIEVKNGAISYNSAKTSGQFVFDKDGRALYVVIMDGFESADKDNVLYAKAETKNSGETKDGFTFKVYMQGDTKKTEVEVTSIDGQAVKADDKLTGYYTYTENSKGALKLTKLVSDKVAEAVVIDKNGDNTVTDSYLNVKDVKNVLDMSDMTIVDLTEGKADKGNAYESEISSVSALKRAYDKEYKITATLRYNSDDEVVTMFVTKVEAK